MPPRSARRRANVFVATLIPMGAMVGLLLLQAVAFAQSHDGKPMGRSEGKAARLARLQQHGTVAVPKLPVPVAPAEPPSPPLQSRTIGTVQSLGGISLPFDSRSYSVTNLYQELYDGKYIGVYAGTSTADPQQGLLRVVAVDPSTDAFAMQDYALPKVGGAAFLVSLTGEQVSVSDQTGNVFVFDVTSRKFLTGG